MNNKRKMKKIIIIKKKSTPSHVEERYMFERIPCGHYSTFHYLT
jgi:hypothetical protein